MNVTYTLGGNERTDDFVVASGKCGGKAFIDIGTDAASFADGIKITVGDAAATVDMSLCKSQAADQNIDQLSAIYAYSKEVKKYVNESKEG